MEKIFNATLAAVALWSSSGVCAQLPKIDPGENPLIAMYVVNGKPEKLLPDGVQFPLMAVQALLAHNIKEFTNLAAILPEVYAEFIDSFR